MEKPIVFTNLPHCYELCHILVSIDSYEKKDKSVKSDFQWQLLKTRLLLYSDINIIATPAAGLLRYIHVISKKKDFYNGSLSALFRKLKLKVESVGPLSLSMYEQCLLYNLLVKLSPFWNKVEKYYVEGRYFLMHRGVFQAIELNIILKDDMLMLYASPLRLWLREVLLLDLLPSSNIEETLSKPFYIDLHSERQWVHVLPSFKRGHLGYVTNRIPKDSTFEDYQQMRRHWKNTYGYRLPEDDSSAIYVGISFFGNKEFLYPLECVRRGMHMNIGEADIVANFAKAVASKAAFVCGNKIKLMNLTELQNMPKNKISERLKWSDSHLAELDSELLDKWLFQDDDSRNMTFESENISLYKEQEVFQMPFTTAEDDPNKNQDYDNWLTKCSQFIDKLTNGGQKRSFLKASNIAFNRTSAISPLKADSDMQPSMSTVIKSEEDTFLYHKESDQSHSPFKKHFNKIELNFSNKNELEEPSDKERLKLGLTIGNCHGAVFENNFGDQNDISQMNVTLSAGIPFKPVFKKKKHHRENSAIKTLEERKINVYRSLLKSKSMTYKSIMNVKKNGYEEIQKKKTENINHEKSLENQGTIKYGSNLILNFEACPSISVGQDEVVKEGKSEINYFTSDTKALPVVCENKNININIKQNVLKRSNTPDIASEEDKISFASNIQALPLVYENKNLIAKHNVVKRSNAPSSAPKERKKITILTAAEIEDLVYTNKLEKANVPSLCCYLKGRGIPYAKDRKKDALLKKVKEIIMPDERRE